MADEAGETRPVETVLSSSCYAREDDFLINNVLLGVLHSI